MQVGDQKRAIVLKVEDFGAFVSLIDVPNVTGLVHKSELSWDTFMTVDDVIKEGACQFRRCLLLVTVPLFCTALL